MRWTTPRRLASHPVDSLVASKRLISATFAAEVAKGRDRENAERSAVNDQLIVESDVMVPIRDGTIASHRHLPPRGRGAVPRARAALPVQHPHRWRRRDRGRALVLAEVDSARTELAAEQRFGRVPITIGTVAYFGAMVPTKKRVTAIR